jgi:5-formyltetrahydrofolate cyclo-ligase
MDPQVAGVRDIPVRACRNLLLAPMVGFDHVNDRLGYGADIRCRITGGHYGER